MSEWADRRQHEDDARERTVECVECGCSSGPKWTGWAAYRTGGREFQEPPELGFYCPTCNDREFRNVI